MSWSQGKDSARYWLHLSNCMLKNWEINLDGFTDPFCKLSPSPFKTTSTVPFTAACTVLGIIIVREVSQKEKGKYCMISVVYGI